MNTITFLEYKACLIFDFHCLTRSQLNLNITLYNTCEMRMRIEDFVMAAESCTNDIQNPKLYGVAGSRL